MLPSTGTITRWSPPEGPGIRVDAGVAAGSEVSHYYDPMLAKLIVSGDDRAAAIARLQRALRGFVVDGVRTNYRFCYGSRATRRFARGETTTRFLDERLDESIFARRPLPPEAALLCAAALLVDGRAPWRIGGAGIPLRLQHGDRVTRAASRTLPALRVGGSRAIAAASCARTRTETAYAPNSTTGRSRGS